MIGCSGSQPFSKPLYSATAAAATSLTLPGCTTARLWDSLSGFLKLITSFDRPLPHHFFIESELA